MASAAAGEVPDSWLARSIGTLDPTRCSGSSGLAVLTDKWAIMSGNLHLNPVTLDLSSRLNTEHAGGQGSDL